MPIRLYDASIPVFHRYLNRLLNLVDTAEKHVRSRALDDKEILEARLAPDMLPFETQVRIAANFALRACFPLAGQPVPPYGEFPASFDGLRACLARASALLATRWNLNSSIPASRVLSKARPETRWFRCPPPSSFSTMRCLISSSTSRWPTPPCAAVAFRSGKPISTVFTPINTGLRASVYGHLHCQTLCTPGMTYENQGIVRISTQIGFSPVA
jgi:hypothetical protein